MNMTNRNHSPQSEMSHVNRRKFLQTSGSVGAALALTTTASTANASRFATLRRFTTTRHRLLVHEYPSTDMGAVGGGRVDAAPGAARGPQCAASDHPAETGTA